MGEYNNEQGVKGDRKMPKEVKSEQRGWSLNGFCSNPEHVPFCPPLLLPFFVPPEFVLLLLAVKSFRQHLELVFKKRQSVNPPVGPERRQSRNPLTASTQKITAFTLYNYKKREKKTRVEHTLSVLLH